MVLSALRELVRESNTPDRKFLQDLAYYFELRVPPAAVGNGGKTTFLFPLILGPESYTLSEPFALNKELAQGAGLWTDENGIVTRTIKLRGNTGFQPRKFQGSTAFSSIKTPAESKSFTRPVKDPIDVISGQKHFQFLQDAVFRTYGDLKKNPATSAGTLMLFHIPREDEHWIVKPEQFELTRTLDRRNLYVYSIDLLIVGPAKDAAFNVSEDKNLLDAIKDAVRLAQTGVDLARASITELTNLVQEIEKTIKGFGAMLTSLVGLIDSVSDFVNGVVDVVKAPFETCTAVAEKIETCLSQMVSSVRAIPDSVQNAVHQARDAVHRIGSFPEIFQSPTERLLEAVRNGQEISTSTSRTALVAAASSTPPNSFQKVLALGTSPTAGDLQRARSELNISKALAQYQSADEKRVGASDTLQSLAARYLGDARLYRHIAVLNGLEYPFISPEGLPGTLRVGDKILIPSRDKAPRNRAITPVLGVLPSASAEERVLGTDLAMEMVDGLFDFVIDNEGGSTDLKKVSGVPNLSQALLMRLSMERGTDQLYTSVGVDPLVGAITIPELGADVVGIRVSQAVQADPRVNAVKRLSVTSPSPDVAEVDMDVEVIGISGTNKLNLTF